MFKVRKNITQCNAMSIKYSVYTIFYPAWAVCGQLAASSPSIQGEIWCGRVGEGWVGVGVFFVIEPLQVGEEGS